VTGDRFLVSRGLRLRVRSFGGGAPAAVLLHGWLDHLGSLDGLGPLLAPCAALEFRGHGASDRAPPGGFYHFVEYLADLDGALDALGLDKVRLVGHSLGGSVSLLYAAARPGRVEHATLIDAVPLTVGPEEVPLRLATWLDELKAPRRRRLVASVEEAADRLRRFNPRLEAAAARHLAGQGVAPDPEQEGKLAWLWDPLLRAHSPMPFTEPALQAAVAQVKAPVLVIRGGSGFMPEAEAVRSRFAALPRLRVETIEGGSHHLHLERPGEVAAIIREDWARL